MFDARFWWGPDRRWYGSLGVSTLVHICLIAVLGLSWIDVTGQANVVHISTRWSPSDTKSPDVEFDSLPLAPKQPEESQQGGSQSAAPLPAGRTRQPIQVRSRVKSNTSLTVATVDGIPLEEHESEFSSLLEGSGEDGFAGDGLLNGDGQGLGGFFGMSTSGQSFVFVVDCSLSMNHPHPSEAKTRFRLLKMELVRSILGMDAESRFFIIFFNDKARPMPAQSLQPANPLTQERYLPWVARIKAAGRTDPRKALRFAMRLRPDVIYFLTDGSFDKPIQRELRKLRQPKVAIHTFAFGNREAETLLKKIAADNGGKYRFIP